MKIEEVRKEVPAVQQQTLLVSCHIFNNRDDIDRLLELVGVYLCQHAKATV